MAKADIILTGGRVVTGDGAAVAEAIAAADGRVLAVGADDEVRAAAPDAERAIDLAGRTVVPGLIDSHMHMLYTGWSLGDIDVYSVGSIDELVERMSAAAGNRDFIAARSDCLHASHLAEGRLPNAADLDRVSSEKPVAVTDVNKTIVNSVILNDVDCSEIPPGGEIGRNDDGSPNGVFLYAAKGMTPLGAQSAASGSKMSATDALLKCQEALLASGLTGVVDASVGSDNLKAFAQLRRDGRLKIRVRALLRAARYDSVAPILKDIEEFGGGDDVLRIAGVKLFYDWFLMHRTALFYEPYVGQPENTGRRSIPHEELTRWLRDCAKAGLATGTHTTGTKGLDEMLETHERIADEVGLTSPSHLIHAYFPGERAIERAKALGMGIALQPSFIRPWAETAVEFLGPERAAGFTPVRSCLDAGVVTGGGTDSPITHFNPFASAAAAASRLSAAGNILGEAERVTNAEALAIYTTGSAEITGESDSRGRLVPGALADMVVCSADPLSCEPDDIRRVRPLATIVGGEVVYSAPGAEI